MSKRIQTNRRMTFRELTSTMNERRRRHMILGSEQRILALGGYGSKLSNLVLLFATDHRRHCLTYITLYYWKMLCYPTDHVSSCKELIVQFVCGDIQTVVSTYQQTTVQVAGVALNGIKVLLLAYNDPPVRLNQ